MKDSNLISILRTFSDIEIKEFENFVNSPFFNKNQNVVKLNDLILLEYPFPDHSRLSKTILHEKIYPGAEFSDENIKTLIYLLTRLAEQYLSYKEHNSNKYGPQLNLLSELDGRNLDKQFMKHQKKIDKLLSEEKFNELGILKQKVSYDLIKRDFYIKRGDENTFNQMDSNVLKNTVTIFLMELFRSYNSLKRKAILSIGNDIDFHEGLINSINLEEVFSILKKHNLPDFELVELYHLSYLLLKEPGNKQNYRNFADRFQKSFNNINKNELYLLSTLHVNAVQYVWELDNLDFAEESLEAYKILISLYEYSGDTYLRSAVYRNVLRLGVQLKHFEWVENFITEYAPKLHPNEITNMKHYSDAYLAFAKGEYGISLEHSSKVNFNTFQMKYHLRNLQLMSFFELAEFEPALSLIDSYRHFIHKEKYFSLSIKKSYLDFIKYTEEMIKLQDTGKNVNYRELRAKVSGSNPMRKKWLLEKIGECEVKNKQRRSN